MQGVKQYGIELTADYTEALQLLSDFFSLDESERNIDALPMNAFDAIGQSLLTMNCQ